MAGQAGQHDIQLNFTSNLSSIIGDLKTMRGETKNI